MSHIEYGSLRTQSGEARQFMHDMKSSGFMDCIEIENPNR